MSHSLHPHASRTLMWFIAATRIHPNIKLSKQISIRMTKRSKLALYFQFGFDGCQRAPRTVNGVPRCLVVTWNALAHTKWNYYNFCSMGIDWIRHANAVWKCTSISVLEMSALIKWRPVCRWLWVRLCQCASHISHRALALYFTPIAQSCMSRWFYFNRFQQIRLSAVITNEYGSLGFIFPVTCCWRAGYWCCVSKHSNRCNAIQYDRVFFFLSPRFDSVFVYSVNLFSIKCVWFHRASIRRSATTQRK